MSRPEQAQASRFTWPQIVSLIVGALFFLIGLIGFVPTGLGHFASHGGGAELLGFGINPLHNIVHIVIGLLGLGASTSLRATRGFGWFLLIAYGVVLIFGLFAVSRPGINFLNLNVSDNWLHGISALIGAGIAAGATKLLNRGEPAIAGTMSRTASERGPVDRDHTDRTRGTDHTDRTRGMMNQGRERLDPRTGRPMADGSHVDHPNSAPGQRMPDHDVPERMRRGYDERRGDQ
jgi:hypothetical protein